MLFKVCRIGIYSFNFSINYGAVMSSKVIKEDRSEGVFKMREFATVERGERDYNLRSFADDEELSVQDMFSDTGEDEPDTIEEYEDEITEKDYWPPSRLAKAEDGIVGEKVDLPAGKLGQGFVEAPMFSDGFDNEPKSQAVVHSRNTESSIVLNDEFIPNPEMSPLISESELAALKNELTSYKEQIESYKAHAEEMEALKLTVEKALMERDKQLDTANAELETLKNTMPEQLAAAKEEGRQEGFEQARVEFEKQYEAEKSDYMAKLDVFYKDALSKIEEVKSAVDAIDEQIPATVIGFVKTLIGQERKINDSFALNIIKQNLSRLHEFRDIKFKVNPEDVEITKAGLPDYEVIGDVSVAKGAVIVDSKSGEIALNVDTMINDLEKEIDAQLTAAKSSQT